MQKAYFSLLATHSFLIVFGVDLTTLVKAHNTKLPTIVEDCVREVEKRGTVYSCTDSFFLLFNNFHPVCYKYKSLILGMDSEGIYRVSGFADDIEYLKNLYDKG